MTSIRRLGPSSVVRRSESAAPPPEASQNSSVDAFARDGQAERMPAPSVGASPLSLRNATQPQSLSSVDPYAPSIESLHNTLPKSPNGAIVVRYHDDKGPYSIRVYDEMGQSQDFPMRKVENHYAFNLALGQEQSLRYAFVDRFGQSSADPHAKYFVRDDNNQEISLSSAPDKAHLQRRCFKGPRGHHRFCELGIPKGEVKRHLYMQDGQNLFGGRGRWRMQKHLDDGTLVVGIFNSGGHHGRVEDYCAHHQAGDVGGPAKASTYLQWMQNTVMPAIENDFGTPGLRGVGGSSLGGLFALYAGLQAQDDFDFVLSMSGNLAFGALRFDDEGQCFEDPTKDSLLSDIRQGSSPAPDKVCLYLDSGGRAQGPGEARNGLDNYNDVREAADIFAQRGYAYNQSLHHWHEAHAPHSEGAWAARLARPMKIFASLPLKRA